MTHSCAMIMDVVEHIESHCKYEPGPSGICFSLSASNMFKAKEKLQLLLLELNLLARSWISDIYIVEPLVKHNILFTINFTTSLFWFTLNIR